MNTYFRISHPDAMSGKVILDSKRLNRSIGTLGGGNHFVELDLVKIW